MGYHYIPRHYLRGFFAPGSELVWVYQKGKPRPFQTGLVNVAQEIGYYSAEIEQYLANEIEGPAQSVIDKIRQRQLPDRNERIALVRYMAAMLNRVPESKERLQSYAPQVASDVRTRLFQQLDEVAQFIVVPIN